MGNTTRVISSKIPQVLIGNIWSRDAFRPIAREQIYLIDHNGRYLPSRVNIRFGMYSRDNTAQKDDFNSFIPQSASSVLSTVSVYINSYYFNSNV